MNVLVLTSRPVVSRSNGYDLRVHNLCKLTPGKLHLAVVPLDSSSETAVSQWNDDVFVTAQSTPPLLVGPKRLRRHLRLSDRRYLQTSTPETFVQVCDDLKALVRDRKIEWIVVFGGDLAEVAEAVGHSRVIVDICDSVSLTARRDLELLPRLSSMTRWKARLDLARCRASEARLPHTFRFVTTISEPDSCEVRDLAGPVTNVFTVPNGVDDAFLSPMPPPGQGHGVAFWGNLQFGPNEAALRFLLRDVYMPYLRDADVRVCIVGPNAPTWLVELASQDTRIELHGFVPDVREVVTEYPVMVNPMRTGSGLKNKVLEAFGMGLAVVTTSRGVDALPAVQDGKHVQIAEDGQAFAEAVLGLLVDEDRRASLRSTANSMLHERYRWEAVAESWLRLFR